MNSKIYKFCLTTNKNGKKNKKQVKSTMERQISIREDTYKLLEEIAKRHKEPIEAVVDKLVKEHLERLEAEAV